MIPEKFLQEGTRYYAVPECVEYARIRDGALEVRYFTTDSVVCHDFVKQERRVIPEGTTAWVKFNDAEKAEYPNHKAWRDAWMYFADQEVGDLGNTWQVPDGPVALCEEYCECSPTPFGGTNFETRHERAARNECDKCNGTGKQYRIVRCEEMTGHIQEFLKADTIMDEIFCAEDWTREHDIPAAILCIAPDGTEHLIERTEHP